MNTVTISFTTTDPDLIFTGVTSYKYDPAANVYSIVHDSGTFDGEIENVRNVYIA